MTQATRVTSDLIHTHIYIYIRTLRSFLGYVDLQGTTYKSDTIATGFGGYLAQPLLRKAIESRGGPQNVTEEDAIQIIHDCMRVLYYRDARSLNKVNDGIITR